MWEYIKGKRTYIFSGLGILLGLAHYYKLIDDELFKMLAILDVTGIGAALRAGMKNTETTVVAKVETVEAKVEQVPVATAHAVAPAVVQVAAQVAQETVAASGPPLVRLTGLPHEPRP